MVTTLYVALYLNVLAVSEAVIPNNGHMVISPTDLRGWYN